MTDGSEQRTTTDPEAELVDLASRRPTVADEVTIPVGIGGEVLVVGGLRLAPGGTDASREVARAIAHAV